MLVLALDASTGIVTVAVGRAGGGSPHAGREVLVEVSVPSRGASEALLPAVHATLGIAGVGLGEVETVVAGAGPGTFTGIRIALATARSLALATGATLSKSSTLAALAAPALSSVREPHVLAVLDARRRQVFAQRFVGGESGGASGGILCETPEDLGARLPAGGAELVIGDGAVRYREALSSLGFLPPDGSPLHRVTAAGHVYAADLAPVPPEEVVPIYVREPDAEVRRDLNPWSQA